MIRSTSFRILLFLFVFCTIWVLASKRSEAEDCTGVLPTADCTLDEDTTAPLTIDGGFSLFIDTSVTLQHTIDGDDNVGDGSISTVGAITVDQTSDIGSITPIEEVLINDDSTWNSSGAIITDNDGSDINLGAADGGETLNFNTGGSYSGEIDGNFADVVNFGADGMGGTFTTGGQIESVTLIITSGASLEVNNTVGGGNPLNSLDVQIGSSLIMNSGVTVNGALDNDGTITVGPGNRLDVDTYTADADAGTFIVQIARNGGATETGIIDLDTGGGALDLSNDTLEISVDSSSAVLIDETIANVIISTDAAVIGPNQFVDNSFLYQFTLVPNGNNFDLQVAISPLDDVTTTQNNRNVADVILNRIATTENEQFNTIQSLLAADSNSEDFNERLESLQPTVDGGYIAVSSSIINRMDTYAHQRVKTLYNDAPKVSKAKTLVSGKKDLRTGRRYAKSRYAKQNITEESGALWIQPFLQSSTQEQRDDIDGFEATTQGVIFGADTGNIHEDALIGIAAIAAASEVDSENANATNMEVQTFGMNMYGGLQVSRDTIVDGSVTYTHGLNDYTRRNIGGITGNQADGEFVSEHLAFKSRISHRMGDLDEGFSLIPSATLAYDYIDAEAFNEIGLRREGLAVEYQAVSKIGLGAGVDANWKHQTDSGNDIQVLAYAKGGYDFGNDDGVVARANFLGAPRHVFETKGFTPQDLKINVGSNVDFRISKNTRVSGGYDFEYQEEYSNHTGHLNVVRDF